MKYEDAEKKALTVKWKVVPCHVGEDCWCRTIHTETPIKYKQGDSIEEYYIVGSGELNKLMAEYFVKLHNNSLKINEK